MGSDPQRDASNSCHGMKYWNKEFNWIRDFMKGYLRKCYEVEAVIGTHDGKVLELAISDLTKTIQKL
jgi:hypothetical protein